MDRLEIDLYDTNSFNASYIFYLMEELTQEERFLINKINKMLKDLKQFARGEEDIELKTLEKMLHVRFSCRGGLPQISCLVSNYREEKYFTKTYPIQQDYKGISMEEEVFFSFAKEHDIKYLLVHEEFYDIKSMLIYNVADIIGYLKDTSNEDFLLDNSNSENYFDELKKAIIQITENDVKMYNGIVNKIDSKIPSSKSLYFIYDGRFFSTDIVNNCINYSYFLESNILWIICIIHRREIVESMQKIKQMYRDKYAKENYEKEKEKEQKQKIKINELKEKILADEAFQYCTTISMRMAYLKNLLKDADEIVLDYLDMYVGYGGEIYKSGDKARMFLDELWRIKKNKS